MAFLSAGALRPAHGLRATRTAHPSHCGAHRPARSGGVAASRRVRATLERETSTAPVDFAASPLPLIGADGTIAPEITGRIVGVFAVTDASGCVRHVSISRDVATSLRRALARCPDSAHGYVVERFARPSRAALEETRARWAAAAAGAGTLDDGRAGELWERPADVNDPLETRVSEETREGFKELHGRQLIMGLKKATRVIQADVEERLKERGVTEKIKFDPKLKDRGLLDVQSVKMDVPEQI